ncbi:MAG TPA: glycine-rich protein [Acidimicrobiales bacterium]|nr:glycine-rich protein [Acidimicrobiales bacterium]
MGVASFAAVVVPASPAHAAATGTCTESGFPTTTVTCTPGSGTWTPPAGATSATFTLQGAAGGASANVFFAPSPGGKGGATTATMAVVPGTAYTIAVGAKGGDGVGDFVFFPDTPHPAGGAGGAPGGGAGSFNCRYGLGVTFCEAGGGGGGASVVATGPVTNDVTNWVLAAGGGGGAGFQLSGGDGGGTTGADGGCTGFPGGQGGGQTTATGSGIHLNGSDSTANFGGGGGGAGYVGGGASVNCGGGGGSGFAPDPADFGAATNTGDGTVTITYTVCTRTMSGSPGSLTIPSSGTTCVSGGTVGGNLNVPAGASLALTNETVHGNLTASGANSIAVCGSSISGSMTVVNTTGQVLVGDGGDDGSPGCAGNTVGNNVTLNHNSANTELGGSSVSGSVYFTNNTGTPSSTETSPEIEANHISGALTCSGNVSVTNDNLPNTVGGARSGQCAAKGF